MMKAKKQLDSLMKSEPHNVRIAKYYLGKIEDETYQGVKLSGSWETDNIITLFVTE